MLMENGGQSKKVSSHEQLDGNSLYLLILGQNQMVPLW